ncbi:MAG TPA: hypothetical protein V6D11_24585 [Waterburya sp.]
MPTCRLESREVEEDARAAVACALSISDRLAKMNQSWQRPACVPAPLLFFARNPYAARQGH